MGESLPWLPSQRHDIQQRRVSSVLLCDMTLFAFMQVSELTATARLTELLRSASLRPDVAVECCGVEHRAPMFAEAHPCCCSSSSRSAPTPRRTRRGRQRAAVPERRTTAHDRACPAWQDLPVVHVGPRSDEEIKELVDQQRMLAWLQLRTLAFVFVVYSCTAGGPNRGLERQSRRVLHAVMRSSLALRSTHTCGKTPQWKSRRRACAKGAWGETLMYVI